MKPLIAKLTLCAMALPLLAAAPIGKPAPNFSLAAKGGKTLSLAQFKGQVVMLNFWASWCGPCKQEMPILDTLYQKYSKLGFTLIGVNVEPDSTAANVMLKSMPVSFPVAFDTQSKVSQRYGVSGMPTTVMIDRKGVVRLVHRGYKPGDENEYLNSLLELIRE